MAVTELSAQWHSAAEHNLEFSLLSLVAAPGGAEEAGEGDDEEEREEVGGGGGGGGGIGRRVEEKGEKVEKEDDDRLAGERLREDWGPALEWVVRGVGTSARVDDADVTKGH